MCQPTTVPTGNAKKASGVRTRGFCLLIPINRQPSLLPQRAVAVHVLDENAIAAEAVIFKRQG